MKKIQLFPKTSIWHRIKKTFLYSLTEPYLTAHNLIGEKIAWLFPFFKGITVHLEKSRLKVPFHAYISLIIFTTILNSLAGFVVISSLLITAFHVPFWGAIFLGINGSMMISAFSIIGFYLYPIYRADKLKREIEDELPFITDYMAILANANVSTDKIFYSLSSVSIPSAVSIEAENIVRDVKLFGFDLLTALEQTSKTTPSESFRNLLEGLISLIHSGGDLPAYLQGKSGQYRALKRRNLRKFSDTLSIISEFYVALLITGPLLLIIMFTVMTMLGGGGFGVLSPNLLLSILTYLGIPLGSVVLLIILDAISPRW